MPRDQFATPAGQQIADWYAQGTAALLATLEATDPTCIGQVIWSPVENTLWKRQPAKPEWISGDIAAANALLTATLTL